MGAYLRIWICKVNWGERINGEETVYTCQLHSLLQEFQIAHEHPVEYLALDKAL